MLDFFELFIGPGVFPLVAWAADGLQRRGLVSVDAGGVEVPADGDGARLVHPPASGGP